MPAQASRSARQRHQNPLEKDILASAPLRTTPKKRKAQRRDDEEGEDYVDSRASRKILRIGQELEEEEERDSALTSKSNIAFAFESRSAKNEDQEDEAGYDDDEGWGDETEAIEEAEVDPSDLDLFNRLNPNGEEPTFELNAVPPASIEQGTNLADLILQRIEEHQAKESGQPVVVGGGLPEDAIEIPLKVVEVYAKVGAILSRYKSGQLPKPFKVLPTLPQWEDLLSITKPESWTPNACFEATKIFISAHKKTARTFIETVLLERVREDIRDTGKVNVHLFKAMRKATFKPEAFFKGLLFPLIESGSCSQREAHVVVGVLTRASIPSLHSAAALMRLCDIASEQSFGSAESAGACNIFIKALLDKQYALPYRVIDNLVFYFLRFRSQRLAAANSIHDDRNGGPKATKLPVLWHQCLLSFAQRYRNDITEDQREALLDLLLVQGHKAIGPEVRKELLAGRGRGVPIPERTQDGGDDTMVMDST